MEVGALPADDFRRLASRARLLSWFSLGWMTLEGIVAVIAGVIAGSTALIGFGIDSAIEGVASVIIIWRFSARHALSEAAEQRAQKLVALSFFVLAPYIAFEATQKLIAAEHPETTWVGMALAAGSILLMPWLGAAKARLGARLDSRATVGEGRQNMLCAYLAGGVLAGLAANALIGLWWLDPVVALGIAAVAVREGQEAWRGDPCCAV